MKFKTKIFLMCIGVYLSALIATSIIVTEKSYNELRDNETNRSIKEEENLHSNITLYLLANRKLMENKIDIREYSGTIVDMYSYEEGVLELYDGTLKKLSSRVTEKWNIDRAELQSTLTMGKNYVFRKINGKYYIFVSDVIHSDGDRIVMAYIKDITYLQNQRIKQYRFFAEVGIVGLVVVAILINILGKMLISPIETLNDAAAEISSGNYGQRVAVISKDEIGGLAHRFNIMADEVEKKMEELEKEGEKKQRFIDSLTHELRTPLTSIIGYSDLMLNIKYDEEIFNKSVGYINSEGKRMLKMVNYLMDIILVRETSFTKEKQSIHSIFIEVIDIIEVKANSKKIKLMTEGEEMEIFVDKDLIKEALLNLVDNAINASKDGAIVTLGTGIFERKICIYVRDEGRGMTEDEASKVIEPFYRVDKSRSRKEGGMGLGLAICNEIVKLHEGKLKFESEFGKGTTVKIIFQNI